MMPAGDLSRLAGRPGPRGPASISFMWVRGAAIRPVPRYAVLEAATLDQIER
jgi:hypothetical protein